MLFLQFTKFQLGQALSANTWTLCSQAESIRQFTDCSVHQFEVQGLLSKSARQPDTIDTPTLRAQQLVVQALMKHTCSTPAAAAASARLPAAAAAAAASAPPVASAAVVAAASPAAAPGAWRAVGCEPWVPPPRRPGDYRTTTRAPQGLRARSETDRHLMTEKLAISCRIDRSCLRAVLEAGVREHGRRGCRHAVQTSLNGGVRSRYSSDHLGRENATRAEPDTES